MTSALGKWAWSGGLNGPTIDTGSDVSNGEEQWAWSGGQNRPTLGTGSDVSNGGAVGVVWGQDRPAIGVGSDVSVGRSGRGLEARTGLK